MTPLELSFDLTLLNSELRLRIEQAAREIDWIRQASAADLLDLAVRTLGSANVANPWPDFDAIELGDLPRHEVVEGLTDSFPAGTGLAVDLADQIQLCRAFANPSIVTASLEKQVGDVIRKFPQTAEDLRVGHNPGDVLDPFILAANFELLSDRSMSRTIEFTAAHKVIMKIEDLAGNLHQNTLAAMRGNFRIPEPQGSRATGKEELHFSLNPFPGADLGQVPVPSRPSAIRLFQVKSKTGSAKGGDGKRLGDQMAALEAQYRADTFFVAIVGNTLKGHRSKGGVLRASPNTAILVGEAALNELTQSAVGAELLLRVYQRAFKAAAQKEGYEFAALVGDMIATFEEDADDAGEDFLTAWLHGAVDGPLVEQDSRAEPELGS